MKKVIVLALAAAVAAGVSAAALAKPTAHSSASATQALSCKGAFKFGFVSPLTGGAGFLGQEQLTWMKYALSTLAKPLGLKVALVQQDTPVEQGAAVAQTAAQKLVADSRVVEVIGPSTSGAVAASTQTYFQAGMAHISPSATRVDLTYTVNGTKEGTPAFFRVVPADNIQGPSDAAFMVNKLKVKKVVIFDFQEPYSQGLASQVDTYLKAHGVSTSRLSAPNTTTDYSSYVTKVPSDADIVFFPTQKPGDAQTVAEQLVLQGKKATVFGGDGSNDPSQFKKAGSYVSNFAPDITGIPGDAKIIAGWKQQNPGKQVGSFGPPTYLATQVALNALKLACVKGHGSVSRADVFHMVKKVRIPNSILGGTFRWSTKTNDPLNAKFYIFQIQADGSYKLVG
jgi:branched-chain amino acid transport system substrate-binding protein